MGTSGAGQEFEPCCHLYFEEVDLPTDQYRAYFEQPEPLSDEGLENTEEMATNRALVVGPAESRLVRVLFYIGEGAMLGGLCYVCSALLFLAFGGVDLWFVIIVAVLFALVGGRSWAVVSASRASQPPIYHEWTAVRHWWWVGIVAVGTTGLLIGLTVFVWGWRRGWSVADISALGFATYILGLVLRTGVQNVLSRESDTDATM